MSCLLSIPNRCQTTLLARMCSSYIYQRHSNVWMILVLPVHSLPHRQRLSVVLQRILVLSFATVHRSDIVIRSSNVWMILVLPVHSLPHLQCLFIVLKRLLVLSFATVHRSD